MDDDIYQETPGPYPAKPAYQGEETGMDKPEESQERSRGKTWPVQVVGNGLNEDTGDILVELLIDDLDLRVWIEMDDEMCDRMAHSVDACRKRRQAERDNTN